LHLHTQVAAAVGDNVNEIGSDAWWQAMLVPPFIAAA
jgi:hypothetical protein